MRLILQIAAFNIRCCNKCLSAHIFYPFPANPQPNGDAKSAQRVFNRNGICGAHRQGLTCNSTNFNLELPKARGLPPAALVLRVGITAKTSGVRERNARSSQKYSQSAAN